MRRAFTAVPQFLKDLFPDMEKPEFSNPFDKVKEMLGMKDEEPAPEPEEPALEEPAPEEGPEEPAPEA